MYPKSSKHRDYYDDFDNIEDDFYDNFESDFENQFQNSYNENFLYSSDRDYGIYNMDLADVASDTECTGLLARGTGEPDELSEYREMFNFGVADDDQ